MTDFKAKMHQIRFRLGLRPRPRWGAYSAPRSPSWIWGAASRQGEWLSSGKGGKGEGNGREGEVEGGGKWRGGKGRAPNLLLNQGPSEPCYTTDCFRDKQRFPSKITNLFHPRVFNAPTEGFPSEFCNGGSAQKPCIMPLPWRSIEFDNMCICLDKTPECVGRTNERTDLL